MCFVLKTWLYIYIYNGKRFVCNVLLIVTPLYWVFFTIDNDDLAIVIPPFNITFDSDIIIQKILQCYLAHLK